MMLSTFITANNSEKVNNQFRIGLYPSIQYLYSSYFPLTSSINGPPTDSSTINYAAANLASLLDTNTNSNLGSGGTHIDTALSLQDCASPCYFYTANSPADITAALNAMFNHALVTAHITN
jgi:hypothetical protein